jgi:hypothetical protein
MRYIYLFTRLFKLSRISFPAAGFSRKLGMSEDYL